MAMDYVTVRQAGKIKRRSKSSIMAWIRDGLPHQRTGGIILIKREDLRAWKAPARGRPKKGGKS